MSLTEARYTEPPSASCVMSSQTVPKRARRLYPQPQLPRLWRARFQNLFEVPIVDVLILGEDKVSQGLLDQGAPGFAQQASNSEIGFQNQPPLVEVQ